jgi:hypothetical protein
MLVSGHRESSSSSSWKNKVAFPIAIHRRPSWKIMMIHSFLRWCNIFWKKKKTETETETGWMKCKKSHERRLPFPLLPSDRGKRHSIEFRERNFLLWIVALLATSWIIILFSRRSAEFFFSLFSPWFHSITKLADGSKDKTNINLPPPPRQQKEKERAGAKAKGGTVESGLAHWMQSVSYMLK